MSRPERTPFNPSPFYVDDKDLLAMGKAAWEHSRVEFVIKQLGLQRKRSELANLAEGLYGMRHFTFQDLLKVVPSFPFRFCTENLGGEDQKPLHRDSKAMLPYWFKGFEGLPFVPPYKVCYETYHEEGRPVGLIFPRQGFQQGLVIFNDTGIALPADVSCFMYRRSLRKRPVTLYVMPFHVLVTEIKRTWSLRD